MCSMLCRTDIFSASCSTDRDINDLTALIKLGQLSDTDPCPIKPGLYCPAFRGGFTLHNTEVYLNLYTWPVSQVIPTADNEYIPNFSPSIYQILFPNPPNFGS